MALQQLDLCEDEIVNQIEGKTNKRLVQLILDSYNEYGLTYKVRESWVPKDSDKKYYRIFLYIKKSKEALIINTGSYSGEGFSIQLRIKNRSVLNNIGFLSQNVRNSILNATDCRAPNCSNDGCEYVFYYQGKEYRKCHMICSCFFFRKIEDEDVDCLMEIIRNEIIFDLPKKKRI